MQTEPCTFCGKYPSTLHWAGHGDICSACYETEYRQPLLKKMTKEERDRAEKITNNFNHK